MNILDKIFNWQNKERGHITDESSVPIYNDTVIKSMATRKAAREFMGELMSELALVNKINILLNEPIDKYNPEKHLKATFAPHTWLNNGKCLVIIFSLETTEPISAYFKDD